MRTAIMIFAVIVAASKSRNDCMDFKPVQPAVGPRNAKACSAALARDAALSAFKRPLPTTRRTGTNDDRLYNLPRRNGHLSRLRYGYGLLEQDGSCWTNSCCHVRLA